MGSSDTAKRKSSKTGAKVADRMAAAVSAAEAITGERLRALQAPFKDKYRADAASALITMRASGTLDQNGIACNVATPRGLAAAGLHPAAGGSGKEFCSGEMVLEALVGCAGVTLKAVATAMGIALKSATVSAEGDCDFRGTLGIDKSAPVGFTAVRLSFDLVSDAPKEQLDQLVKLAERYCVVYQTLAHPPPVQVRVTSRTSV